MYKAPPALFVRYGLKKGLYRALFRVESLKNEFDIARVNMLGGLTKYSILAASPLASSGFAAIGDWKGLCPFQTSIF